MCGMLSQARNSRLPSGAATMVPWPMASRRVNASLPVWMSQALISDILADTTFVVKSREKASHAGTLGWL